MASPIIVYENPDMTPAQRNEAWMGLERKYRPWEDFEDLEMASPISLTQPGA